MYTIIQTINSNIMHRTVPWIDASHILPLINPIGIYFMKVFNWLFAYNLYICSKYAYNQYNVWAFGVWCYSLYNSSCLISNSLSWCCTSSNFFCNSFNFNWSSVALWTIPSLFLFFYLTHTPCHYLVLLPLLHHVNKS